MPATIYYDNDADLSMLKGKTVAILGYGSQGHAQAQNLRDSGVSVIIGQRPGSPNYDLAVKHGFKPMSAEDATKQADIVKSCCRTRSRPTRISDMPNLKPGNVLMCSHGFNIHFQQVTPPDGVDAALVAPKGPGHLVRSEYVKGGGVPTLIAMYPGASEQSKKLSLAYAKGSDARRRHETTLKKRRNRPPGAGRPGGGVSVGDAAFETLVEAGYQPEMAYFECMHELKLIVDLFYQGGLNYMRYSVSNTAEYGDYTRGPRIVNEQTKAEMKKILSEIQQGQFARDWILENKANQASFKAIRRRNRDHQLEQVGRQLRSMMTWIDAKEV
jgi:ketol-acid reductoisomerase